MQRVNENFGLATAVMAAYAASILSIVAGAHLADPTVVDIGFDLSPERTAVVGIFLMAAGAVLAFNAAQPKLTTGSAIGDLMLSFAFGRVTLFAFATIEVLIGARALIADPPNGWAALLLLPGLLSVPFVLGVGTTAVEEKPAEKSPDNEEPTTPATGQINVRVSVSVYLFFGVFIAAFLAGMVALASLGFWTYRRLDSVILGGEDLDAETALQSLWQLFGEVLTQILPLVIVSALSMFVIGAASFLFQWFSRRGIHDANRDLSAAEIAFIDKSVAQVRNYAHRNGYDRKTWQIKAIGLACMIAVISLVLR